MPLSVLAFTPHPMAGPSSRQRVFGFVDALAARGVELKIRPFMSPVAYNLRMSAHRDLDPRVGSRIVWGFARRFAQRHELVSADVIWVHRQAVPAFHRVLDRCVLPKGVPIVFDMDDAVFAEYPIRHLLRRCAAATVGNQYLSRYVGDVSPDTRCTVIPTVVDTDRIRIRSPRRADDPVVVGWIGTPSTFRRYLLPMLHRLVAASAGRGAAFRVVSSQSVGDEAARAGAEFRLWTLATADGQVQHFDIGVMPLVEDEYSMGKCAFKLIEYGAAGIASIGSDVGINREVLVNGRTGLLATSDADFVSKLEYLLDQQDLRTTLGTAARAHIEQRFSVRSQADLLAGALIEAASLGVRGSASGWLR